MNIPEKYRELVNLFNNERYMKTFGCELLGIDSAHAFIRVPLNPEHANFSGILFGGITAMLGDVAAPVIALTEINSAKSVIRLHTIETRLLKPILFEDEALLLVAEIADKKLGKSNNGKHDREKITVITTTYSVQTGEEKAVHYALYDVVPRGIDLLLASRERNKIKDLGVQKMSEEKNAVTGESLLHGLKQAVAHRQGNIVLDSVEVTVTREKKLELSQEHFEAITHPLLEIHKQPPHSS